MSTLENKVALVTGASSGIGRETALALAEAGAAVVIGNRRSPEGEEVARQIRDAGGRAAFLQTDVSKEGQVEALVELHRQFQVDLNWILLGVEAVRREHDLTALEEFEVALDKYLSDSGTKLKSEKRGAIAARWYRSFLEGKEIAMDDVHTWIELLRE